LPCLASIGGLCKRVHQLHQPHHPVSETALNSPTCLTVERVLVWMYFLLLLTGLQHLMSLVSCNWAMVLAKGLGDDSLASLGVCLSLLWLEIWTCVANRLWYLTVAWVSTHWQVWGLPICFVAWHMYLCGWGVSCIVHRRIDSIR
jgi:hypothetical protein